MGTFLFDDIVFGPVQSRRLGESLGINLLPVNLKVCNFDCIYCECGLSAQSNLGSSKIPTREEVHSALRIRLFQYREQHKKIDTITFAGNGEPTLHPDFEGIISDTLALRDELAPTAKVAVLSNATLIRKSAVRKSLLKVDYNILKLDSAKEETIRLINCPGESFSLASLVEDLQSFHDNLVIQTLFLKGRYKHFQFDNASDEEVKLWLDLIRKIKPLQVMIYTIARDTPVEHLEKISESRLREIASQVEALGTDVQISA